MESLHLYRHLTLNLPVVSLSNPPKGFTLAEIMIVLGIIITITSVAFTSQNTFNKTLILTNTAYDIALSLRSAETYGLGGRVMGGVANTGYGIHFDIATPRLLTFFADTYPVADAGSDCHAPVNTTGRPDAQPGNCSYESGSGQDAVVTNYTLGNGIMVSDFCAYTSSGWSCAQGGGLTKLDIVFSRPNPDPFISTNGVYSAALPVTAACLIISTPQGDSRFVSIAASGAIAADASSCP